MDWISSTSTKGMSLKEKLKVYGFVMLVIATLPIGLIYNWYVDRKYNRR